MIKMINNSGSPRFGIVVLLLASIVPLCGWAGSVQFATSVDLVEVYATVTDARGEPVSGLTEHDLVVTEDGVPQAIATFAAGEFPLSVAVGLDRSFSMTAKRVTDVVAALRRFITALEPADQVMVIAIGSETEVLAALTTDHASSIVALERVEPWGTTPLYDAIRETLAAIQPVAGRRALILLSDGVDRYSRATEADVVVAARRNDVLIYPIALGKTRPPIFAELASLTGGRSFHATDRQRLETTLATIARELRFQYLLGYTPARPIDQPRWHSIRVAVKRPNVKVRAREGYFSR